MYSLIKGKIIHSDLTLLSSLQPLNYLKPASLCSNLSDATILFIRLEQVNLLVFGPDRVYLKQKQKNNITRFWPTCFFIIYYFLLLAKRKKNRKEKKK